MTHRLKQLLYQCYLQFCFNVKLGKNVKLNLNTFFEGGNALFDNTYLINSRLGYGTYIANNSCIKYSKIGRFCAIGDNVRTGLGMHPTTQFVSIHPAFFSVQKQAGFSFVSRQLFQEHKFIDSEYKFYNEIKNDVWIGNNSLIMDGVTIGNGSVVAAGSVVTKNVDDYAIVGGVPANFIKYRFNEKIRKFLLEFKWWEKDIDWIRNNCSDFVDINMFYDKYSK